MTERVRKLREESLGIDPYLSSERAEIVTDFYAGDVPLSVSTPVCRALCFRALMERRTICVGEGEWIVGERGPAPKATPTYPELCCHSLEDLRILDTRKRTPYRVPEAVRAVHEGRLIPFWRGKTMRERLFAAMSPAWHAAFDAGVFTEFMEQRAPGHAILDGKIYEKGFLDFRIEIARRRAALDPLRDPDAYRKGENYKAMEIVCDALIVFAGRYAAEARQQAAAAGDPVRQGELLRIAAVCEHVPAHAPWDFHEALQMYWFVHLGVISELNTWDSFNPGRLDQHLYPFYRQGLAAGTLTDAEARELLQCFWIKFNNQPAPPKVGVTEEQSGTYTDFALINIGGVDLDGRDAVNPISFMVLDVMEEMRLTQPSGCIQLAACNPDSFLRRACEVVRSGFGQPSLFNTDVIIRELLNQGKCLEDARNGGPSGCVTVSAHGKESCCLTGYCNWPKILELALHDGRDPRTGVQIGPHSGDPRAFAGLDDLLAAYEMQLRHAIDLKHAGNNVIERLFATYLPSPFMSVVMDDCIEKGLDYHEGGARYNPTYIQGVGLGTLTDCLAAVQTHVFAEKSLSMAALLDALERDFEGAEPLRRKLLNQSPAYGNDDPRADAIATRVFEAYYRTLHGRRNTKGGEYQVNLLPTTCHIYFGAVCGALPNGRGAGLPVSDGISPSHGADRRGPTAVVKSAACFDHSRTGGTLLNMKFAPEVLEGAGLDRLAEMVRSYFRMGGHHVQFNVIGREVLLDAQRHPERHRNLVVRVAGYSDYFNVLGKDLQDEIIARTENSRFAMP
ncbi:MAG: glycyl radical protein [Lentisphaeria bacterium]|nr:glycyl radical protein [Lentisphaeria bacterium]